VKRRGVAARSDPPLRARQVVTLMLRRPEVLTERDRRRLEAACARSAALAATCRLVRAFMGLLRERRGEELAGWVVEAAASGVDEVAAFAAGLRRDWAAVVAGLTLEWSSGAVEGQVNRVKMLKRQMYGRAKLDLLRKRVLLAS
jgi:transposase